MKQVILSSKYDNTNIYTIIYEVSNPKAVVQIIHGMKEHQGRYERFAEFLNQNGYTVITSDLRGHGKNTTMLGYMEGKKPWEGLVLDQVTILEYIKSNYNLPIYLFAHSMGTIIARNLIQEYNFYEKIVLSGVPAYQFAAHFGIFTTNLIGFFRSNSYVSNLLEHLTLGPFEKSIKNAKTKADWISYNPDNIKKYLNDPYCNIPFTVSAYKALYHLVVGMHKHKKYVVKDPNTPILMLIGRDDPCPLGEKGFNTSIKTLNKAGYNNVSKKVYSDMRHEILNEIEYLQVFNDILNFYS